MMEPDHDSDNAIVPVEAVSDRFIMSILYYQHFAMLPMQPLFYAHGISLKNKESGSVTKLVCS